MPDVLAPLTGRDAAYAELRAARFALLGAVAALGARLAPIARPPWNGAAGSIGVEAHASLDHLEGIAAAASRDFTTSASEFAELLESALPFLNPDTIAAAYTYLAARRATT